MTGDWGPETGESKSFVPVTGHPSPVMAAPTGWLSSYYEHLRICLERIDP